MEKEWKVLRVSAGCMLPRVHPARGSRASGWRLHKAFGSAEVNGMKPGAAKVVLNKLFGRRIAIN